MSLEVVYGGSRNGAAAHALVDVLRSVLDSGIVYLGYPVLPTAEDRLVIDALLVSEKHGLVAFGFADGLPDSSDHWDDVVKEQDDMYAALTSFLTPYEDLRHGRRLAFEPHTATLFASEPADAPSTAADSFFGDVNRVGEWLTALPALDSAVERPLQAALQRVTTIKPTKRRSTVTDSSRGGKMRQIEREIANLDRWQRQAAIESPEGPQRIRGLAGSGKTVVLALKAAYWHTQNPQWNIALTFQSRALYQHIDDLVERFTFEHSKDRPDPDRMHIVHSWGSRDRAGMYMLMAEAAGAVPRDFNYAQATHGREGAFAGICRELLEVVRGREVPALFDAILIDEAQDLPPEFFQLAYAFCAPPKRIVWGFDELQRLSEATMPSTDDLFGTHPNGQSVVSIERVEDGPQRDVVLPRCYRNTPWALAVAHAVGLGIYRPQGGLVQHPDEPNLWRDIGYEVRSGELVPGHGVTLARASDSSPDYFSELLSPADAVLVRKFDIQAEQDEWIAGEIATNLTTDQLEHDDILIVLPDAYTAKTRATGLGRALARRDIPSHLSGVGTSQDELRRKGSVAMAHIWRAKGNEAAMVYAVDAHRAIERVNQVTRRNTLFTAITRSRAWVRITGFGDDMTQVAAEIAATVANNYELTFTVPTSEQLAEIRHRHRDRGREHEARVRQVATNLAELERQMVENQIDLNELPPELRTRLIELLRDDDR
ncbi:MAG TPA: ATP-binding domain-containing protein [Baekduia sp.]|uniref:DEAD/DEAH box helicase n=1 Tax=Baekduia sp. TaxID=2600305 RepID=UPI002CC38EE4|nr:ATP-binding domain-containing protein [Baekduia sp.]HMJ35214.1 ATP-binding domain-containing protein [Baekduia sp.]